MEPKANAETAAGSRGEDGRETAGDVPAGGSHTGSPGREGGGPEERERSPRRLEGSDAVATLPKIHHRLQAVSSPAELLELCTSRLAEFNPAECAAAAHRPARCSPPADAGAEAAAAGLLERLAGLCNRPSARQLSNAIWPPRKSGRQRESLAAAVRGEAAKRASLSKLAGLSNLAQGPGRLERAGEAAADARVAITLKELGHLPPQTTSRSRGGKQVQEVSNLGWAPAKLGYFRPNVLDTAAGPARGRSGAGSPQETTNLV